MITYRERLSALLGRPTSAPNPVRFGTHTRPEAVDPAVGYLTDLLADTREELSRVDSKAALLLAASGVIIGSLVAGLLGSKWTPFELNNKVQWLWWLGVASAGFGVLSIAAAVYPHVHPRRVPNAGLPAYYGDVAGYENIEAFRTAIEQVPSSTGRLIHQTFVLSGLVWRKYLLLQRGLRCMLLATAACLLAVLINIPLRR